MREDGTSRATGPVGRESELAAVRGFVASAGGGTLLLAGGPGIGKTTIWEAGVELARDGGVRVLAARPSDAEAQLAFAALTDLFETVELDLLASVPPPQRTALEVALLRAEAAGPPPDARAIAAAVRSVLGALAAREPVLVAIDDVQWLDPPSADALAFAARRLGDDRVRFLLAQRTGTTSRLAPALGAAAQRLELGPLSLGATRRMLGDRLGLTLPRHLLRRVVDATLGNPLFALEVGRTLAEGGRPAIGEDLPVPDTVEELLGARVSRAPRPVRRALLAVALSADLRRADVARIAGTSALDRAVDAGLLAVDGDRARPSHPLLAAVVKRASRASERRELHRELAAVVPGEELRALHLALAAEGADASLAATVAWASETASARGARRMAVELAEHALRLTPGDAPERSDRVLALARALEMAGELQRVTDLVTPELPSLPPGAARVRAWLLLAEGGGVRTLPELERHLDAALEECGDDPALRAHVLAKKADHAAASAVMQLPRAQEWALEADRDAHRAGPEVQRLALLALAWARSLRGQPIDDVCARFRALSGGAASLTDSPERVAAQRLVWRGEVDEARVAIARMLVRADEQGEPLGYALQRLHLCELELRVGAWDAAEALLDEWAESSEGELLIWPMYERCRALVAAGRGIPEEAERWGSQAVARAEASGGGWDRLEGLRALGVAALLAHDPERAAERLQDVWAHTKRQGVDEPGVFPVAPDLVEALVELGDAAGAARVTARLRALAEVQAHPWGLATADRCDAVARLAGPAYDDGAASRLAAAAEAYGGLGLPFDRARALLALGRAARRQRKWGSARAALEESATAFGRLGSHGWAEAAGSELARVGARRPRPAGELTAAERRAVELAAEGLSNKEIAHALVVTVPTVEGHLSRAYAKLGVRSRRQLAARLAER